MEYISSILDKFSILTRFEDNWASYSRPDAYLYESKDSYTIEIYAQRFSKDEIKIFVEDDVLHIEAENKKEHFNNKSTRKLSKQFKLPDNLDSTSISTSYENSVIKITIPKVHKKAIGISANGTKTGYLPHISS